MPVSPLAGFGVELLMTFVVTLTVLTSSEGGHRTVDQSASVVIGLAVTVCHLFGVILLLIHSVIILYKAVISKRQSACLAS